MNLRIRETQFIRVKIGIAGPPGPIGPRGNATLTVLSATALGGHRLVTLDGASAAIYADAGTPSHSGNVLGLTIGAGETATILHRGEIAEPSWHWILGQPVFLGQNGLLTQSPPQAPSLFSLIVAFPVTATTLFISLREPIFLNQE